MKEPNRERGPALTIFAICFALLAVSNLLKPLQLGPQVGFVLLGIRLSGIPNAIAGPLFGIFLGAYAYGIWNLRRFALPLSHLYAIYVPLNLVLFSLISAPAEAGPGYRVFQVGYAAVAVGVSAGAAVLLTWRKEDLA